MIRRPSTATRTDPLFPCPTRFRSDADLLVALQQRVVELAIGVGFALEDVVLDAAAVDVQGLGAQRSQFAGQQVLLRQCRVVLRAYRGTDVEIGRAHV